SAVFGRQEAIRIGNGSIVMTLVKNPVGCNQALQTITAAAPPDLVAIAINDLFADGTDVSWLWDVDFELLAAGTYEILCSGLRAHDMAVRLKYAGVAPAQIRVEPRLETAVETVLDIAGAGKRVALFPTYTAMLAMRRDLQQRGIVAPFWE